MKFTPISVKTVVKGDLDLVWKCFTEPEHVMKWNFASEDWHCPEAKNDLRAGGSFCYKMAAKDGSFSFNFEGIYEEVVMHEKIAYALGDERRVKIEFIPHGDSVELIEIFDAEGENSLDMQRDGWQSILNNFKRHVEKNHVNRHKIVTHLWFDKEAGDAAEFYLSVFENSRLIDRTELSGTPSGTVESFTLQIEDHRIMLLSAGPYVKVNPSISFMVSSADEEEIKHFWNRLSVGGNVLMPFDTYPFSPLYGWVEDRFGVSWQLMWVKDGPIAAKIKPALMFVGENAGHAEEAIRFYTETFKHARINAVSRYGDGMEPNTPEMLNYADFVLEGQHFSAMDSAYEHDFYFNDAISIIVNCESQEEIDYYWEKLSAVPESEQCGWIKDRYGLSWQITPDRMNDMMREGSPEALKRVTEAFLKMKKFDLATLEAAYRGE